VTSALTSTTVVRGVLSGDLAVPVVSKSGSVVLSAALPAGSVTDTGLVLAYQWLRDGAAIVGATGASFTLSAADYNKSIAVRVTAAKLNYTAVVLTSAATNYSVTAAGTLAVTGTLQVGETVAASALSYATSAGAVSPVLSYIWYRNGIAIVGATGASYTLVAADFGAKLSVRVTAAQAGFLSHAVTSALTATTVVKGVLSGDLALPVVTKSGTLLLSAALPVGSVTDAGTTTTYQWLRDGVAIPAATAASFQLTALDYGKSIAVRVTVSKLNYTPVVLTSAAANHSVIASVLPGVSGTAQVGQLLSIAMPSYSTSDGAVSPALAYQWLRNGVVIAGATSSTYTVVAADFGTRLSVRVTATTAGFLPSIATTALTAAVALGVLAGDRGVPTLVTDLDAAKLTVALAAGSVTDAGIVVSYQWLRNGVAIVGATAATYTLTSVDYGQEIRGRVTVTKLNYTPVVLLSPVVIP
jgi:hypothetical protein